MLKWKNILYGLLIALIMVGVSFGISRLFYQTNQDFYWGNSQLLLSALALIVGWSTSQLVETHIRRTTKDRFSKITWDHPIKSTYYTFVMVLYWAALWGALLNYILYYFLGMGFYNFETSLGIFLN